MKRLVHDGEEAFDPGLAIVQLIDLNPKLKPLRFIKDNWSLLADTYDFLQPFNEVNKLTESVETPLDEM